MKVQSKRVWVILLLVGILCSLLSVDAGAKDTSVILTGGDFSQWRGNTGQWEIVGDTFIKPDNNKLLSSKSGMGVIVNGPTGRTSNLFSKDQFGDIKAHIEFMVPEGSNSGG